MAEHDESRAAFQVPDLLQRLVDERRLGQKSGAGFYKKEDGEIKSVDPETLEYTSAEEEKLGDLGRIWKAGSLEDRLRALYEDDGRAGQFFRETTLDLLGYSARRIGEVTDNPADVDRAIRWGFGWELGPFQMWDALGFETVLNGMEQHGIEVPGWISATHKRGPAVFYQERADEREVYIPSENDYVADPRPEDELRLDAVKADASKELWANEDAALLDLGDGVALYEFRSKGNALGQNVMSGLAEVIDKVENDPNLRGLVIGNEGKNFSVGANLGEMAMAAAQQKFDLIEEYIEQFQATIQQIRYATKPVVVATHQRVLGGGCEMAIACPNPVADSETYIGLVELGVGLIPAGTGTMRMAEQAAKRAPNDNHSAIQPYLRKYFENIAMAEVAESAAQGKAMGYLAEHAPVVMNSDRRLYVAKQEVLRLSEEGYLPPPVSTDIQVLGRKTAAAFEVALHQYRNGDYISDYDVHLGKKLAHVITGGNLSAPQTVHEDYLIDLEREAFMSLLGEQKTMERVQYMLENRKPLRN
jgi:3-hydroxyacyl-CoA dehydrogenase